MKIYISQPRDFASNLPLQLQRVAKLYRAGVIDAESTIWCNTNVMSPVFWSLSDRATAIFWVDAPTAGWVRLASDRVRWAPTYEATSKDPTVDVQLSKIGLDNDAHVTVVVDHGFTGPDSEGVCVVDAKVSHRGLSGGFYAGPGLSIVDLPMFDRGLLPPHHSTQSHYAQLAEAGLAFHLGAKLLTVGMTVAEREAYRNDLDSYAVDLSAATLDQLVRALDLFDITAGWAVRTIYGSDAPAPGPPQTADTAV